jgi:hypothetical protein
MQVEALSLAESAPAAPPEQMVVISRKPPRSPPVIPACWTTSLLGVDAPPETSDLISALRTEAARFAAGLGLAAIYGLSLGMRHGGRSLFVHAFGVPLAIVAIAGLGVPALYIVLTLFNVPIQAPRVLGATARASAYTGLVLAGLAPAAALFVVSTVSRVDVVFIAGIGLIAGGTIGLKQFLKHIYGGLSGAGELSSLGGVFALMGFALFSIVLAARIWWSWLPVIGGVL